jgi:hypothetical protein
VIAPKTPAGWTVRPAADQDRSRVPRGVLARAVGGLSVLSDRDGSRRSVAAAVAARGGRDAQRLALDLESRAGPVEGNDARFNDVRARPGGHTFVGRRREGGEVAVWLSAAPPSELLSAARARAPRGRLITAAVQGMEGCRPVAPRVVAHQLAGATMRGLARREASSCGRGARRVGIVALEPARGVRGDAVQQIQNTAFLPRGFPNVTTDCGVAGGKRIGGRWVMSFYVNDDLTRVPRWAFFLVTRDRATALKLYCPLIARASRLG